MGGKLCKSIRKRPLKLYLNGLDGAGKTTMLYKMKSGEVVTPMHSIGTNIETVEHNEVRLITWDVGGRDKGRTMRRYYYQGTDAIVFVVDSTDRDRIEETLEDLYSALKDESLKEAIVVITANKQDLPGAMTLEEMGEKLDLKFIRKSHRCEVFGTSATTGEGVNEMLDWVVETVSIKQVAKILGGQNESEKKEKDSKSYFSSPFLFIKNVFSKV